MQEEGERERDVKDIYMAFSDLAWPEMKPGDLSGRPNGAQRVIPV